MGTVMGLGVCGPLKAYRTSSVSSGRKRVRMRRQNKKKRRTHIQVLQQIDLGLRSASTVSVAILECRGTHAP